jgi:hypothetical protein
MKRLLFVGCAVAVVTLGGCGSQDRLSNEVAALKQENADLKARVSALEGKVEAITASLPDNDLPDDDADSSAN